MTHRACMGGRFRPNPSMRPLLISACLLAVGLTYPSPGGGQARKPVGKPAALELEFEELRFAPPRVQKKTLDSGVRVFLMEDHSLPLVTLYARFRGGYALLPRRSYAAATALSGLLRSGGTTGLSPDSVDTLLDYYALQLTFGGGGESTFSSINTLSKHLEPAVDLWVDLLRNPRFDSLEVEVWRDRRMEDVLRRRDDPGPLAVSEFNRIMFGDHPIGWELAEEDLSRERFGREAVRDVYSRVFCPENLILGVVGDVGWSEVEVLLDEALTEWPACSEPLLEPRAPELRQERSVFLIPKDLTQSTIIVAGPGGISQSTDPDYFASRIGNSILGGGGFSSRLLARVRTEMGYAYSASSFWTTPASFQGIVGATTQTRSGATVEVTRMMLEIIEEMGREPPEREEVQRVISQIVNSFVFNFQDPAQIVSRQMFYLAQDLPEDWLERFVQGIQSVEPEDVFRAYRTHVKPEDMIILIVGNPEEFDEDPSVLGTVQIWNPEGQGEITGPLREVRRSPR